MGILSPSLNVAEPVALFTCAAQRMSLQRTRFTGQTSQKVSPLCHTKTPVCMTVVNYVLAGSFSNRCVMWDQQKWRKGEKNAGCLCVRCLLAFFVCAHAVFWTETVPWCRVPIKVSGGQLVGWVWNCDGSRTELRDRFWSMLWKTRLSCIQAGHHLSSVLLQ